MKTITLDQLMDDFENIIDDIGDNKKYYQVHTENGDFILMPYEEFDDLLSVTQQTE